MRTMRIVLAAALLLASGEMRAEGKLVVAVVVEKSNPRSEISTEELRALFLGTQREWADGTRAVPLDLAAGTPERELFNSSVLNLDQPAVEAYWVDQRMRGSGATAPRVAPTAGSLLKLAGRVHGVVGYVALASVDASVKVLKVDGIAPGARGYPLESK